MLDTSCKTSPGEAAEGPQLGGCIPISNPFPLEDTVVIIEHERIIGWGRNKLPGPDHPERCWRHRARGAFERYARVQLESRVLNGNARSPEAARNRASGSSQKAIVPRHSDGRGWWVTQANLGVHFGSWAAATCFLDKMETTTRSSTAPDVARRDHAIHYGDMAGSSGNAEVPKAPGRW